MSEELSKLVTKSRTIKSVEILLVKVLARELDVNGNKLKDFSKNIPKEAMSSEMFTEAVKVAKAHVEAK